jgi:hypothetical protein
MSSERRKQTFKHGIDTRSSSLRLRKESNQIRKEKRGADIKRFRGSEKMGLFINDGLGESAVFSQNALREAVELCAQVSVHTTTFLTSIRRHLKRTSLPL